MLQQCRGLTVCQDQTNVLIASNVCLWKAASFAMFMIDFNRVSTMMSSFWLLYRPTGACYVHLLDNVCVRKVLIMTRLFILANPNSLRLQAMFLRFPKGPHVLASL